MEFINTLVIEKYTPTFLSEFILLNKYTPTYTPTVELVFIIAQPTWTVEFEFIAQSGHIPWPMSGSLSPNRHENVVLENHMRDIYPDQWVGLYRPTGMENNDLDTPTVQLDIIAQQP